MAWAAWTRHWTGRGAADFLDGLVGKGWGGPRASPLSF